MLRFNHKYYILLLTLFAIGFAGEDIQVEKESDGLYEVTYEKRFFDVGD